MAKITGKEGLSYGTARPFNSEEKSMKAILAGKIKKGDVIVIRYEGPKGGPGMREMLDPTAPSWAPPRRRRGAYHRQPFLRRYTSLWSVTSRLRPTMVARWPWCRTATITIDAESRELKLGISKAELKRARRLEKAQTQLHHWRPRQVRPPPPAPPKVR